MTTVGTPAARDEGSKSFRLDPFEIVGPLMFALYGTVLLIAFAWEKLGVSGAFSGLLLGGGACGLVFRRGLRRRIVVENGLIVVHDVLRRRSIRLEDVLSVEHSLGMHEHSVDALRISLVDRKPFTLWVTTWTDGEQAIFEYLQLRTVKAKNSAATITNGRQMTAEPGDDDRASDIPLEELPDPWPPPKRQVPTRAHSEVSEHARLNTERPSCGQCGRQLQPDEYGWGPGPHFWQECSECGDMDVWGILTAE